MRGVVAIGVVAQEGTHPRAGLRGLALTKLALTKLALTKLEVGLLAACLTPRWPSAGSFRFKFRFRGSLEAIPAWPAWLAPWAQPLASRGLASLLAG